PEAISALARVGRDAHLNEAELGRVVDTLAACLPKEGRFIQRAAVSALESLGGAARPALPALETLNVSGPRISRMQEGLDRAIKKIRDGGPVQVEVADLRDEVKKLKKENESLRDRIATMEGKQKAAGQHANRTNRDRKNAQGATNGNDTDVLLEKAVD